MPKKTRLLAAQRLLSGSGMNDEILHFVQNDIPGVGMPFLAFTPTPDSHPNP
jgi:hypothetical protein